MSKLNINKPGLRIHNSPHKQCRVILKTLSAHIRDFRIFKPTRNRIGGKTHAGQTLCAMPKKKLQ